MSMFNTGDILETIEMFTQDNLDVRTVTMGISLLDCIDPDPKKACENIYNKITTKAANLVSTVERISAEYGIPIINKRISVTPIAMLLGACPEADPVDFAKTLDAAGKKVGVNFVGGYSALVHKGFSAGDRRLIESIPRALAETDIVCSSVNIGATKAGLNMDAIKLMGEAVKKASELTADRQCIGAAKLVVFCNAPEDNPFMAGAFHGPGEPDCEIHVGVSGPGAVRAALARLPKDAPIDEVAELVKRTAFKITRVGQLVANLASKALGVPAGIIDLSLAPTPAIGDSVANILEEMGLETCGYIDSLQNTVDAKSEDNNEKNPDEIYISIPDEEWNNFAKNFSIQVYNNKADYKKSSLLFSTLLSLLGGVITFFISGHALKPLCDFSKKIEEVQAQNLSDSRIEENKFSELNQLSVSYNKMLERLSEAFKLQRQFTANAAHELRTPLAVMQLQIDLYNSSKHPDNDTSAQQTISMITEQTERLSKMVRTLLDMSELQTIARDEEIAIAALVEEVLADLEPLAQEKGINLIEKCDNVLLMGSDILIYRLVYNLVENAIKYNFSDGTVTVTATQQNSQLHLTVEDTGNGIPEELKERIFEPFFRLDKSRSRELGGVGLGLALVREIVRVHNGSILVKNNANSGTTFEVIFP